MPATSKSQQRLFCMALAVRKGDLPRSKANDAVLKIVDSKMTNKQIEDFTVLKENRMIHLKDYISESILSSVGAGKTSIINKIVSERNFTQQNITMLERDVAIWKPKDKTELIDVIKAYIKSAGLKCSLNWIDVSNIKDISNLFRDSSFNGDISKLDTHNVTNMSCMFYNSIFNGDISKWDTHNVTDMSCMFSNSNFNGDISDWDVSNVTDMSYMFGYSKFNSDISNWNVSNVKDMSYMFSNSNFNGDISKWDVSNVTNMKNMFYNSKFDKDISNWNINNVKEKGYIFIGSNIQEKYKPLIK